MEALPHLITDLGLILGAAAIVTILFKWLKQPLVLGYLIAGFLVGPNLHLTPTIVEINNIKVWAEIGVIFLLFGLGLEFSFKKLMRVGAPASITAIIEVSGMVFFGYVLGKLMNWSQIDSIFLGGVLGISSTTIIMRAFDEAGVKGKQFAGLVFGILVMEDLLAIVLLVLLTTISISSNFSGTDMLLSVAKLIFFLVLWFLLGIFFVPTLLRWAKKLLNEEMLLITSLALCILMVWLASVVGFSPALGAFIMGSILAETIYAEKIEHLLKPVKDLFGAVFFVSVGMLFNPSIFVNYAWLIILLIFIIILGKIFNVTIGALVSGQPLKISVQAGFSLAQIGEFSFIIASLGMTLKVTSDFIYPIAIAVSAITTFTTPYLLKLAEPFYNWLVKVLPPSWLKAMNRYSNRTQKQSNVNEWQAYVRSWLINSFLISILITSIVLLSSYYLLPFTRTKLGDNTWTTIVGTIGTLIFVSPFLWRLLIPYNRERLQILAAKKRFRGSIYLLHFIRIAIAIFLIGFLLERFFSPKIALVVSVLLFATLILLSNKIRVLYTRIKKQFLLNYNEREQIKKPDVQEELAPWDAHLASYVIDSNFIGIGKTLQELAWRENFGINVARIFRGNKIINTPNKFEKIYPLDKLAVIGTDEQLTSFSWKLNNSIDETVTTVNSTNRNEVILSHIIIAPKSNFAGKTIRESGIRESTHGIVVGVESNGERMINPESIYVMKTGDILWIVGDKLRLTALKKAEEKLGVKVEEEEELKSEANFTETLIENENNINNREI